MTPSWLLDLLAVIMLTVAAVTATRIAARPLLPALPWRPGQAGTDVDLANVLMGIAMAGMFTSSLATLPSIGWEVAFGLLTVWFAYRAWADARSVRGIAADRCTIHVVHCAAMLYAFLALGTSGPAAGGGAMGAMSGMAGPAGMATLSQPTVAGAFIALLVGYCVWDLNQLSAGGYRLAVADGQLAGPRPSGTMALRREPVVRAFVLAPGTRVGSDVILGIGMALMLVIMI